MADFTQYSTASPMISSVPTWIVDPLEQQRFASYGFYEQVYWNIPQTFKLAQRGADSSPIYVPAAKTIVETLHRFLAKNLNIVTDPSLGDSNQIELANQVIDDIVKREKFYSRFAMNKRYGVIRGDWLWHFYANPERLPGSKISIFPVDPGSWFPIFNEDNLDEIIGVHLVDTFVDSQDKTKIRRLTYRKLTGTGGPSPITVEEATFEADDWGGPGMDPDPTPIEVTKPLMTLPSPIDSIPLYSISNFQEPGSPYGSSELRGFERIIAAIDQGISDEELSLAMDGLGVYATSAGAPIDPDSGIEIPWNLGPARVVEIPEGSSFERVSGVSSVAPMQDHLKYLHDQLNEASGSPAVARGNVDVTVAESGIALAIDMGPMTARVDEKNLAITDALNNMLYDLAKWYIAYEGTSFGSLLEATRWVPIYGDMLPINKKQEVSDTIEMVSAGLISGQTGRDRLRKLGYDIPDETDEQARILGEASRSAAIQADALGSRIDGELGSMGSPPPGA